MSEKPTLNFLENKDGPRTCAAGMLLLMFALACAIAIGISPLISNIYFQASAILGWALFLILFALGGGYLISKGLIFILRDSRRAEDTNQV
jgi:hypothetical protein